MPESLIMRISEANLRALLARKLTKKALATKLGISATHMSRITPKLPPGPICAKRRAAHELFETRKAFRAKLAKEVNDGRRGLESAAKAAHCSIRTMYRYVHANRRDQDRE